MRNKKRFPKLKGRAILSPMAGVTDVAFRTLCREAGASLTVTEFINAYAINRDNQRTKEMMKKGYNEDPSAIQIFGADEKELLASARKVENEFDIIDINIGCPAYKVIKTGAGSELLRDPDRLRKIVSLLAENIEKPLTVKMRIGIEDSKSAIKIAELIEEAGASAITIHGRTQKQGYSGKADWEVIRKIKERLTIPVVGNGDVFDQKTFYNRLEESGVDYIMVARGAIGNPKIFKEIMLRRDLHNSPEEQLRWFKKYYSLAIRYGLRFPTIKSQAISFTKKLTGGARIRELLTRTNNEEELLSIMEDKMR